MWRMRKSVTISSAKGRSSGRELQVVYTVITFCELPGLQPLPVNPFVNLLLRFIPELEMQVITGNPHAPSF